jgi:hypothetical protein
MSIAIHWDFNEIKACLSVVMLRVVDDTLTKRWLKSMGIRIINKAKWNSECENKVMLFSSVLVCMQVYDIDMLSDGGCIITVA